MTTLPRQNNQIHFGFGKNITVFHVFLVIGCILAREGSIKEHACAGSENVRNGHIYIQLMEKHITLNKHKTRYLLKTGLPQNHTSKYCILAQEDPVKKNNATKCSQWPHLYTTYEATYDLK